MAIQGHMGATSQQGWRCSRGQTQEIRHRGRAPRSRSPENRKYYNAHREAISARRAFERKRAAIEVGQKVTSAGT